jgi:hypothetical protein
MVIVSVRGDTVRNTIRYTGDRNRRLEGRIGEVNDSDSSHGDSILLALACYEKTNRDETVAEEISHTYVFIPLRIVRADTGYFDLYFGLGAGLILLIASRASRTFPYPSDR